MSDQPAAVLEDPLETAKQNEVEPTKPISDPEVKPHEPPDFVTVSKPSEVAKPNIESRLHCKREAVDIANADDVIVMDPTEFGIDLGDLAFAEEGEDDLDGDEGQRMDNAKEE